MQAHLFTSLHTGLEILRASICCMVTRELSFSTSSYVILRNQSPLYTISVLSRSKILNACLVYVSAFSSTCSRERGAGHGTAGRVANRGGEISDEQNSLVAKFLELAQFLNSHGMAQVDVRRSRVHAQLHAQGRPSLRRSFSSSRLITTAVPPINMSNCSSIVIDLAHRVPGVPRLFKPISCARLIERDQGVPATGPDRRKKERKNRSGFHPGERNKRHPGAGFFPARPSRLFHITRMIPGLLPAAEAPRKLYRSWYRRG